MNERDPWYPLRAMLRPATPRTCRDVDGARSRVAKTISRRSLPEGTLHESVDDEWSFVQTLRHLVFAMDKWFTAPILGEASTRSGCRTAAPSTSRGPASMYDDDADGLGALAARADHATRFRDYLASVSTADFTRPIDVLENGMNPLQEACSPFRGSSSGTTVMRGAPPQLEAAT